MQVPSSGERVEHLWPREGAMITQFCSWRSLDTGLGFSLSSCANRKTLEQNLQSGGLQAESSLLMCFVLPRQNLKL